jgi:hypothetical protein
MQSGLLSVSVRNRSRFHAVLLGLLALGDVLENRCEVFFQGL